MTNKEWGRHFGRWLSIHLIEGSNQPSFLRYKLIWSCTVHIRVEDTRRKRRRLCLTAKITVGSSSKKKLWFIEFKKIFSCSNRWKNLQRPFEVVIVAVPVSATSDRRHANPPSRLGRSTMLVGKIVFGSGSLEEPSWLPRTLSTTGVAWQGEDGNLEEATARTRPRSSWNRDSDGKVKVEKLMIHVAAGTYRRFSKVGP